MVRTSGTHLANLLRETNVRHVCYSNDFEYAQVSSLLDLAGIMPKQIVTVP